MTGTARAGGRVAREPRQMGLVWALGLSALLHLLIVLLTFWVPIPGRTAVVVPSDDQLLRFTFAPPSDRDAPAETARGEVPFETPEQQPLRQPARDPSGIPELNTPPNPVVPPAARAALEPAPPQPEPPQEAVQEAQPEPTEPLDAREGEEAERTSDMLLPRGDQGPPRPAEQQRREQTPPEQAAPGASVSSALADFKRAIDATRPQRPVQPGAGTNTNVFVPDVSNMPLQGSPFGILEFSSRDYDWSDYSSQIYWAILRAWYRRLYQTTAEFEKWAHQNQDWMLNHESKIHFVIQRNGDVTDIALEIPAGCPPLDRSALDALSEVILPPLPADFPRDRELVRATFIARGEIYNMRQVFEYYRSIGYF